MSDRALLEAAARAAGIAHTQWAEPGELLKDKGGFVQFIGYGHASVWNALTDDGDALRLAVKLEICLEFGYCEDDAPVVWCGQVHDRRNWPRYPNFPDPMAATRRAIVRAAAALAGDARGGGEG